MLTDAHILASLTDDVRRMPYPGRWLAPPFEGVDVAVVARDGELSELRVDRRTGRVDLVAGTARTIAPSLPELGTLASAYAVALGGTRGVRDQGRRRVVRALLREVRAVSRELAGDGSFWALAAEELGHGVVTADETPAATFGPAAGPTTVIAMSMMALRHALAAEGLSLSEYRDSLAYVTLTGTVRESLDRTAAPGAFRTGPARVLVVGRETELTEADLAFPGLRLLIRVGTAPSGPREVVTVDGPRPFARIAELVAERHAEGLFA
ncbi:MAG: hypothetical protein HOV94_09820 [Saccharothrix sp.]|nr:hypothetical protein [Saccharothrix sp.]